jgi:hypothetical protein
MAIRERRYMMEKIVFKNKYLNFVVGGLLIILAIQNTLFGSMAEEFFPILIGIILILLSLKRFIYTYKKIVSKNATLILVIELILDIIFAGLLIYLKDHVELFIGLIVYIRGVSYLLINYIATRKVKLPQYIINIGYVTLGAFLMFYKLDGLSVIIIIVNVLLFLTGAIYIRAGIKPFVKRKEAIEKIKQHEIEQEKLIKKQEKDEEKLEKLETKVSKVAAENQKTVEESKILQKEIEKTKESINPKPKVVQTPQKTQTLNLEQKTLAELKVIAKERKLEGVSQLNKTELIEKLTKDQAKK